MSKAIEGFEQRAEQFLVALKTMSDSYMDWRFPNANKTEFKFEHGSKYVRVVMNSGSSTSVHCFLNKVNGDILKAASWSAPAKHTRGNIFADDFGMSAVGPHGANYFR